MGCCETGNSCGCRARRGSGAGVIAKALTLLMLGVGVGAAHSVMQPVKLHPDPTAPTTIQIPRPTGGTDPGSEDAPTVSNQDTGATPAPDTTGDSGSSAEPPDVVEAAFTTLTLRDNITLDQTRILWETGLAQFIDARHLDEYATGHIPRAILVVPNEIRSGRMPEGLMFLDFEAVTVVYCGGGDCDASKNAKRDLQDMGFTQVHIFEEGFPAWDAAGLPVNAGEPAASAPRPTRAPGGGL